MDIDKIVSQLNRHGKSRISNQTVLGTYEIVDTGKFFTMGVSNRDNARWKRAQYLIVNDCSSSAIESVVRGFREFAFTNQFLIFSHINIVYDGMGRKMTYTEFLNNLK